MLKWQEEKVLNMAVLQVHKEDQCLLLQELNYYEQKLMSGSFSYMKQFWEL
jgi:hypothetical protein